ncbi:LYAM2 protein, partial [Trogon melanurus]|nr:LYAM2 protein [Trogon melanurus]
VSCDPLKKPGHGTLECNHPLNKFSYNSSCTVWCEEGYEPTALSVHCNSSGFWSATVPACKAVTCPALEIPADGAVNCSLGELSWGTTCEFTCEEGFALTGPATLQCGSSGAWDRQEPSCAVVQCEPLSSPEKGALDCFHGAGNFTYSTACHFSCLEGWRLNGSHVLECGHSGNWSASLPTCEASEQVSYVSVGIAATSASLLSTASFLLWLARRF